MTKPFARLCWVSVVSCLFIGSDAGAGTTVVEARAALSAGLDANDAKALERFDALIALDTPLLNAVVLAVGEADERVAELLDRAREPSASPPEPNDVEGLLDPVLDANIALYIGRELVHRQLFDEALAQLDAVSVEQVVDPATYYFNVAVCHYQFQSREPGLAALDKLDGLADVPKRYQSLAELMRPVLESLDREQLDGIAHDMRDVHRRLELGRTGAKVRTLERDILARLDKLIETLETEQQSQGASGGGQQAGAPAPDSRILGGKGEGKVTDRPLKQTGDWGNLPDKERARALQSLDRQFPPHYKDAIEAYFKKLAAERDGRP